MLDLTVLILTKNEEKNIAKCIRSFQGIARRFVIVDSFSTDRTVEIARSLGADVYEHAFENHAAQMNWGLEHTGIQTEWVMRMDADEELTPELVCEFEEKIPKLPANITGVQLRRRIYFMNRWIRHGGVYPTILLRLFRTGHAVCEQRVMDEHMVLKDGDVICFKKDFIDKNTKSLEWWIGKHN